MKSFPAIVTTNVIALIIANMIIGCDKNSDSIRSCVDVLVDEQMWGKFS